METVAFIDTEIEPEGGKILDIGGVRENGSQYHSPSVAGLIKFLQGARYVCGHNILNHDVKYLQEVLFSAGIKSSNIIDTLYVSPLLFPAKPYHALLKDDKLQTEDINNPLNDSQKAKELFFDEVTAFQKVDREMQQIFYFLLSTRKEFCGFFNFLGYRPKDLSSAKIEKVIKERFKGEICEKADLGKIVLENPMELAYCLALINTKSRYSITPPWVLKNFPEVERVMFLLRSNPCLEGCPYCNEALDIHKGLRRFFGYDSYRTFDGEPLQEQAVRAAIANKSLLAIFPTGGGKSLAFQVPALMSGINTKGLTVVISPLQSLMKDQVDNLEKIAITEAVTINGLLDPIERAKSIERVENGSASILYISPESLRSRTIEHLLLGRNVVRFVIDEAHCFSAWGQDFRVDYLYIGDFIKSFQEKKNRAYRIPISCFTATAKPKVIEDIRDYFRQKLSLELELYRANSLRRNLRYKVLPRETDEEKYQTVRDLLDEKKCPTIIYVSRTRKAFLLAQRLTQDGYQARPYHGRMDKHEKTENQDAFMRGEVQIIVATSAFGMGVDKKDVGMVIHFEISDSLENYIQEAGRAGRDETVSADCYVLFNDEDLNKHFILLNQTKLNSREIQQIWKAIKSLTRLRARVSQSALEIARKAGWDDNIGEIETRVKTAITALEEAGYVKRGQNMPRVYADSILTKNAEEAINKINASPRFDEQEKVSAIRIIKKLISARSRKYLEEDEAEARVDYISDHLGIAKEEVIRIIYLLREERILAHAKDLTAFLRKKENQNHSLFILQVYSQIERFLFSALEDKEGIYNIKELNEQAGEKGYEEVSPNKIITILNFWAIKNWIKRQWARTSKNHLAILFLHDKKILAEKQTQRYDLAKFILEYLYGRSNAGSEKDESKKDEVLVEFSVLELKEEYERKMLLFKTEVTNEDIEDALFFLSRIEALIIEGGFLVTYNGLTIERLQRDNRKRYNAEDYHKLEQFYQNKIQQIHIVGEYARKMIDDYKAALQFVDDYFQLNYPSFLYKYFKGSRQSEIKRNITPAKFRQIFGELSPAQLKIINDNKSKNLVVAAGPGSGKTRILVHKLASLLLMEDVKHEQLLMLTFSRAAATEFKKRLLQLIGNAANFVEIKTFHSYCFDLLGKVGNLEKSDEIIRETVAKIKKGEIEVSKITKTVLVIDEAQDMDADEFALIKALMDQNEEMRVIAVGDDDQNIYEFRGASSEYLKKLITEHKATMYELVENYRSKSNLVDFTNRFITRLPHRLKNIPIVAVQGDPGKIKVVCYRSSHLVAPLVQDILSEELAGTTCVLTKTNEEALQVAGLLMKNGLPSKLIQSNEGFSLQKLLEIRHFLSQLNIEEGHYTISDDVWIKAKEDLREKFRNSPNLEPCLNIIQDFEATNPNRKFISDLEVFIRESKLEDFFTLNSETVFVSTIHKAKGREFDNVFLMLDNFSLLTDEAVRLLYVAMTRAKRNLIIHYNGNYLNFLQAEGSSRVDDPGTYLPPPELVLQLSFKDVWLDFFLSRQNLISRLKTGDLLSIEGEFCRNSSGQPVLRFSKQLLERIEGLRQKSYYPQNAKIRFIVYWKKEESDKELRIVLPELFFERTGDPN